MEVVFIDPEPPGAAGGGIRTYIRLAMDICAGAGVLTRVYTHTPEAYPENRALPIGRKPWLRTPFRGLAYRSCYQQNVLFEHAQWLSSELESGDAPNRIYEFADFLGYGFFALRNPVLKPRIILRVHTPDYLASSPLHGGTLERISARLGSWRERDCLRRARHITAPSAVFVGEKLPWLKRWEHIPNPLPPETGEAGKAVEFRVSPGTPPSIPATSVIPTAGNSGWRAAPVDPAETAERNRPRPDRIEPDRFLYLGRVEERKGVLVLVRAFARLAAEKPFASLTLVGSAGSGPYADSVRELIQSQPESIRLRIAWEPPCPPEARAVLFRRFTALVAPSLWENSPYVYFEGMAAGLACIGSASGEMKAVAEATGALSPRPGDEDDWLKALRAHCSGAAREALPAQTAYLRDRRPAIPGLLLSVWRRTMESE